MQSANRSRETRVTEQNRTASPDGEAGAPARHGQKRILLFNDSLAGGGAERSMAVLANELSLTGDYDIAILSLEDKWGYELVPTVRRLTFGRSYRFGQAEKALTLLADAQRLKKVVLDDRVETVLSFCYRASFINVLARLLGSKHRCLVSERNHPGEYFRGARFAAVARFLIRRLYEQADAITCNGAESAECLRQEFGISRPVHVIPNGYDRRQILRQAEAPLEPGDERYFSKDRTVVLYVSRMAANKGHLDLVKAYSLLQKRASYRLVLIGDGPCRDKVRAEAKRLGLEDEVILLGTRANPFRYMARADIFVMPSYYEGYPNALAEALICGLACVAYRFKSGAIDLMGKNEAGTLVPVGDVEALAQAIEGAKNLSRNAKISTLDELRQAYQKLL